MARPLTAFCLCLHVVGAAGVGAWSDRRIETRAIRMEEAIDPGPIRSDEPLAAKFSALKAARYLDHAALSWQRDFKCIACNTMTPYVIARPALAKALPVPSEPRAFYEGVAGGTRDPMPNYACDDVDGSSAITTAAALALSDRGKLHPSTRKAFERMWALQKPDGSWRWPFRDSPPFKLGPHYAVTLAALATGSAPGGYSRTEEAQRGLVGIRRYLAANKPTSLHEDVMLAWASTCVTGILSAEERRKVIDTLLAAQRPDGGWSLGSLVDNSRDPALAADRVRTAREDAGYGREFLAYLGPEKVYRSSLESDGYATGFAVYVARQCGVPARDERLKRGVAWLKSRQRESGRWFTPSQGFHSQNKIANTGTAFAVLALAACDAL